MSTDSCRKYQSEECQARADFNENGTTHRVCQCSAITQGFVDSSPELVRNRFRFLVVHSVAVIKLFVHLFLFFFLFFLFFDFFFTFFLATLFLRRRFGIRIDERRFFFGRINYLANQIQQSIKAVNNIRALLLTSKTC